MTQTHRAPDRLLVLLPLVLAGGLLAQSPFRPEIPRTWDAEALADLELPLADPAATPEHITPQQYYALPVRPIYASYPIYHPEREPDGYLQWLAEQEPRQTWNVDDLHTAADWRAAGEQVFTAPILFQSAIVNLATVRDARWYAAVGVPLTADGVMPFARYVVRERGKVEVGGGSCASCHSRVLDDGRLVLGAQGNFPFERAIAHVAGRLPPALVQAVHHYLYGAPWLEGQKEPVTPAMVAARHQAIPPGVIARQGSSLRYPTQVPDLIGVQSRRYLDHTAVQRQRDIGDLMRYAAINQGIGDLAAYAGFHPVDALPAGVRLLEASKSRYSDAQLYALAQFVYGLEPPPNPNRMDATARRGQLVFEGERCDRCHTPPLYTNNELTPAFGFSLPDDHPDAAQTTHGSVGTDAGLARRTRRGTGVYKVPSLRGLWYRAPLGHDGAVRSLEEWFNPNRLQRDYDARAWVSPGVEDRAVPGHEFGLALSPADREALIAFLRTL